MQQNRDSNAVQLSYKPYSCTFFKQISIYNVQKKRNIERFIEKLAFN